MPKKKNSEHEITEPLATSDPDPDPESIIVDEPAPAPLKISTARSPIVGDKVTYTPGGGDKVSAPIAAEITHVHNEHTVNLKYRHKNSEQYVASVKRREGARSWR